MSVYDLPGKSFAGLLDADLGAASDALGRCRSDRDTVQRALNLQFDRDCADAEADRLLGARAELVPGGITVRIETWMIVVFAVQGIRATLSELWVHKELVVQDSRSLPCHGCIHL